MNANFSLLDMKKSGYSSASGTAKEVPWYGAGSDSSYPGKTYVFDFQKAWENIGKDHNSVDTSKGKNGLFQVNTGKAQNIALFVQDEYKFNEPWTMYLGLRYDHYKKYNGSTTSYNLDGSLDANNSSKHGEGSYNDPLILHRLVKFSVMSRMYMPIRILILKHLIPLKLA